MSATNEAARPELRQRATTATNQTAWNTTNVGRAAMSQTSVATSTPTTVKGWAVTTSASALPTGHSAEVAASAVVSLVSFGDNPLVDRDGAAILIKPLGLLFPLSLALVALAFSRLGHRWPAAAVLVAAVLWPVAHIANIAPLAVAVNVVLVVALGTGTSLARSAHPAA